MPVSFRRIAGALAFAVFFLRVLAPEVGHACDSLEGRQAMTAVADASDSPAATHQAMEPGDAARTDAPEHGVHHGSHTVEVVPDLAHHGHAAVATSGGAEPASPAPHDAPCDCSDWCCCLPTLTSPPLPVVAAVTVTIGAADAPAAWPRAATPVARADRLLPFATAPPRA